MDGFGQKQSAILLTRIVSYQNGRMVELRKNEIFGRIGKISETLGKTGAGCRTRTRDLLITNEEVWHLSTYIKLHRPLQILVFQLNHIYETLQKIIKLHLQSIPGVYPDL